MADDVTIDNGALTDFDVATDEVSSKHYQRVKVDLGGDGVSSPLVRGQQAAANSLPVTLASDETITSTLASIKTAVETIDNFISGNFGMVKLSDGTDTADVFDLTNSNPLAVQVVDDNGTAITSFSGSGGTSAADDADFTQASTTGTPAMGVYESTPTSVTDNDMGIVGIDSSRRLKVSVDASSLDVAHDTADSGNPVKIGMMARNAFPTAVANADRANGVSDLFGRQLIAHVDPAMVTHKAVTVTTTQTGSDVWSPSAGKRIAVTSVILGSYGTTAGRAILWFGDNADTTYTAGTDQVLVAASFAPSSTSKPGLVYTPATPVFCTTADRELHLTTDANLSLDITIEGYEY